MKLQSRGVSNLRLPVHAQRFDVRSPTMMHRRPTALQSHSAAILKGHCTTHCAAAASSSTSTHGLHHDGHHSHPHSAHHGHAHNHVDDHNHNHSHHHGHGAHGDWHHHHHPRNAVTKLLGSVGMLGLAERMSHSWTIMIASIICFTLSLLLAATPLGKAATSWAEQQIAASWPSYLPSALLTCTFVLSGIPQLVDTLGQLGSLVLDTHVLMSLAVAGTVYLGLPHEGALLLILFQLSHTLEEKFTAKAQGSLARLLGSVPTRATTVQMVSGSSSGTNGSVGSGGPARPLMSTATAVLANAVEVGQHVLVKPGEQVPLDGNVVWGTANVSLQHISGESAPVRVTVGDAVPAGSLNSDGLLVVQTTAGVNDSTPYRIARLAAEAQSAKPRLQSLLDRVGAIWSKAVIAATLVTLVALPVFFNVPLLGPRGAFYRAMGVLTAGSPCAVVLVPLAYVCAIAGITRRGVLVKSAAALDDLASVTHVALDKTGTITSGWLTLARAYLVTASSVSPGAITGISSKASGICLQPLALPDPRTARPSSQSDLDGDRLQSHSSASTSSISRRLSSSSDASSLSHSASGSEGLSLSSPSSSVSSSSGDSRTLSVMSTAFSDVALRYAVALSQASNHPVSRAVVEAGHLLGPSAHEEISVSDFEQISGDGVQGVCRVAGRPAQLVRFGSLHFIQRHLPTGVSGTQAEEIAAAAAMEQLQPRSGASSFLSAVPHPGSAQSTQQHDVSTADVALFCFEDVVQDGVAEAVAELQNGTWRRSRTGQNAASAKQVVMLTGDNDRVASSVASSVGISSYRAGLKPEQKLQYVTGFDATPQAGLLMMGDGINDAPALAAARVGVAVASTPSDMVAAAADLIILNGSGVANLPWLFRTAQKTQIIIKQNLALALIAMLFATLPTVLGVFPLWLAVSVHEGSTLLVALNSLRLLLGPKDTLLSALVKLLRQAVGLGNNQAPPTAIVSMAQGRSVDSLSVASADASSMPTIPLGTAAPA